MVLLLTKSQEPKISRPLNKNGQVGIKNFNINYLRESNSLDCRKALHAKTHIQTVL